MRRSKRSWRTGDRHRLYATSPPFGACCDADGVDIEMMMVTKGLAWVFFVYSRDYSGSEATVREAGAGIWQAEIQIAQAWRDDKWARAITTSPGGCPIKDNIKRRSKLPAVRSAG